MTAEWKWKPFEDQCIHCGCDAEVYTSLTEPGMAYDGDCARCTECGCPGIVRADGDEEPACVQWHDVDDCSCEWCMAHPPEGAKQ